MNIALIVFAGKGERISSKIPKQFIKIKGQELVSYTIRTFNDHPLIHEIVLVTSKEYLDYARSIALEKRFNKVRFVLEGGLTRQESVRKGLNGLSYKDGDYILIHDGDRPLVSDELITKTIKELRKFNGTSVAIKSENALKEVSNSGRKIMLGDVQYDVQTPQGFIFKIIKDAHNKYKNEEVSDDISLLELEGLPISYIEGDKNNFKVTKDQDLEYLKTIL